MRDRRSEAHRQQLTPHFVAPAIWQKAKTTPL